MTKFSETATQNLEKLGRDLGPDFRNSSDSIINFSSLLFKKMLKIIFKKF